MRIAVIGGGISGLAAAHRLTELLPQAQVTLFEASDRLGGVLQTVERDGFLIERSADNFLTKPPYAADLCRQLGLADQLLPTDESRRRAYVVRGGRLLPIPDGFYLMSPRKLGPLLKSPLLSWRGKLRLLAEPLVSRGRERDESVASFARRRLGREAYERIVQPLIAGIYTADPELLSMAATMPQFLELERQHGSLLRATLSKTGPGPAEVTASGARYGLFAAPKYGMKSLVESLAVQIPAGAVQLNVPISCVSRQNNCWHLNLPSPRSGVASAQPQPQSEKSPIAAAGEPPTFDALILATPAPIAGRLLAKCDPELANELSAIPYAGCAVVSLGLARSQIGHELAGFGLVVPHTEGRRIIAASFASQKFPGRAPADAILIRVFMGGSLQPEVFQLSDAEQNRLAFDELSSLLKITGQPLFADTARWPASMPQYHVGHLDRVARIEQLTARWPGLALAGNAYRGVGIPQCIHSGQAAAERIAAAL